MTTTLDVSRPLCKQFSSHAFTRLRLSACALQLHAASRHIGLYTSVLNSTLYSVFYCCFKTSCDLSSYGFNYRQPRWFSQRRSPTPHFGGAHPRGLWPPNSNLAEIWVHCTCTPWVSSSYVYSFRSYRVDKRTNKQTDAAENIQRSSLRYDVG